MLKPIHIGSLLIGQPVLLAPMSGVTDLPFRTQVRKFGCGLVYSEMIASGQMVRAHTETVPMRARWRCNWRAATRWSWPKRPK